MTTLEDAPSPRSTRRLRRKKQETPPPKPKAVPATVLRARPESMVGEWLGLNPGPNAAEPSTTRQVAGLHLAIAGAPTSPRGLLRGIDAITGWAVYHDTFQAYREGRLSSPNCVYVGDVGAGKSTGIKTWEVLRPLVLGRRVIVIDKKRQRGGEGDVSGGEGEYAPIARALGVEPIRFKRGAGGTRINILDPLLSQTGGAENVGQLDLLRAVLAEALGRAVSPYEGKALRVAHHSAIAAARGRNEVATIQDVLALLLEPVADVGDVRGVRTSEELREWGLAAGFELERLLEDDLVGLIDGETSANVSLTAGLTVFDISDLPDDGPAVPIVMAIINAWISATLSRQERMVPTVKITEEGWYLVDGNFAKAERRQQKLARGLGVSNVTALQHVSDVLHNADARAVVQEAETAYLFRQRKQDDALQCAELFGLPTAAVEVLTNLPTGTCLFVSAGQPPIMLTNLLTPIERDLTNTDAAMNATGTIEISQELVDAVTQLAATDAASV